MILLTYIEKKILCYKNYCTLKNFYDARPVPAETSREGVEDFRFQTIQAPRKAPKP